MSMTTTFDEKIYKTIRAINAMESAKQTIDHIGDIRKIISDTESILDSNESEYTKEQAKISAYDHIKELMEDNNNDR